MKTTACAVSLLFLLALPAAAQDVTLFGGFQHPGPVTLGSAGGLIGTGAQITDPKDFGLFGVRFNSAGSFIGFEHTLAYSPNFISSDAFAVIQSSDLIVGVPSGGIEPYGTAGLGFVFAGGDSPAAFGNRFSINYGGGLKIRLVGPLGLRADVRGYSIFGVEDQTLHVVETSVGLLIRY